MATLLRICAGVTEMWGMQVLKHPPLESGSCVEKGVLAHAGTCAQKGNTHVLALVLLALTPSNQHATDCTPYFKL